VFIGTYSSVYVAAPMVLHLHLRREPADDPARAPDLGM
jgi:preprotein translocase subunit SecF